MVERIQLLEKKEEEVGEKEGEGEKVVFIIVRCSGCFFFFLLFSPSLSVCYVGSNQLWFTAEVRCIMVMNE